MTVLLVLLPHHLLVTESPATPAHRPALGRLALGAIQETPGAVNGQAVALVQPRLDISTFLRVQPRSGSGMFSFATPLRLAVHTIFRRVSKILIVHGLTKQ